MGMFDTIRCEYPIDGVEPFSDQTKELDCYMDDYLVTADGVLMKEVTDHADYTDDEKAANLKESSWLGPIWNLTGKQINPRWEPYDYTGALTLYPDDLRYITLQFKGGKVKAVYVSDPAK
jgi:hypothetical protein